ncbi:cytochrome P450 [Phytoactinopolyspora limicola]|uniref:cytochrome P450 n=1 Tax=Phytoactinopolyspora limicola TaxID=2715536 RepID=UPI00140AAFF1|nr:cytochrome P450 [Phytoactinopolyspora limicola]
MVLRDARFSMQPAILPVGLPAKLAAVLFNSPDLPDDVRSEFERIIGEGKELHAALGDEDVVRSIRRSPTSAQILLGMDPPEHARIRRILAGYFTVRRVRAYREKINSVVSSCLDELEEMDSPQDLVENFALPVSSMSICELLGAPYGDRCKFEDLASVGIDPESSVDDLMSVRQDFYDYATSLIEGGRASSDGILYALANEGQLTTSEQLGVAEQLFVAGHHTSANMLALAVCTLLEDRRRWDYLRADFSTIGGAVEELLRYLTIFQVGAFTRTALCEVEINDIVIKSGDPVTVSLLAANHDPDQFDQPSELNLGRSASGHLAFGHGVHQCLGQHLARLELEVALSGLVSRFPTLRLAVPFDDIAFFGGDQMIYGVRKLPVVWGGGDV